MSRLHCAFSESGNCVPILRLPTKLHKGLVQSRDRDLEISCSESANFMSVLSSSWLPLVVLIAVFGRMTVHFT